MKIFSNRKLNAYAVMRRSLHDESLAGLTEVRLLTDKRTDGRTDRQAHGHSIYRSIMAWRGKHQRWYRLIWPTIYIRYMYIAVCFCTITVATSSLNLHMLWCASMKNTRVRPVVPIDVFVLKRMGRNCTYTCINVTFIYHYHLSYTISRSIPSVGKKRDRQGSRDTWSRIQTLLSVHWTSRCHWTPSISTWYLSTLSLSTVWRKAYRTELQTEIPAKLV